MQQLSESHLRLIDELDNRQEAALAQIDQLNERIERLLAQFSNQRDGELPISGASSVGSSVNSAVASRPTPLADAA